MEYGLSPERDPGTTLVPVSATNAEQLHRLTHRAANRSRDVDDWWDTSLATALAVIARSRHSSSSRDEAERTLDRLLRWWRDEKPRRISPDAAALAVGARGAADLQESDPKLLAAAAEAVEDLAGREVATVPMLHIALSVWALDRLIPDRDQKPWPILRECLVGRTVGGVDEPLRVYATAVAAKQFDANALVRNLFSVIGTSPSANDACVLLWLASVAIERLALSLKPDDNALQLLVQRRAALVERLVSDIDDDTFLAPEFKDFGEPVSENLPAISFLSTFEALLIDLALASPEEAEAWLTFAEAEALFAAREAEIAGKLEETIRRHHRRDAWLLFVIGLIGGVVVWLGLERAGWMPAVAESLAVTTAAAAGVIAALKWRAGGVWEKAMELLGLLFITIAVAAIVNAFLNHYHSHRVSEVDFAFGSVLGVLILAIWAIGTFVIKKESRALVRRE